MKPERWQQIDQILEAALERDRNEWAAFLDQECAGDEELRREVESLLRAHEQAGSFIEKLPPEAAGELLPEHQSESLIGKQVASYRIERLLGRGGMGEVYLATDKMERQVALKLLAHHHNQDKRYVARFAQEAQTVLTLNHPNIVTIYDIGEIDGTYYFASELIEGETLRLHLERGEVEINSALEIAIQVATALAYAHEKGIVHRDIKPENVMIRSDGYVKVLDFGIAKLTEEFAPASSSTEAPTRLKVETAEGVVIGTASYMSPEQAKGTKVDARTDLWSLGAMLYEMVTGHVPFAGETPTETISLILQKGPAPLSRYTHEAPAELERIVTKALTKDREQRYQTAKDLLIDLRNLKRKLEVDAEIDRTAPPEMFGVPPSGGTVSSASTAPPEGGTPNTRASSAEYIVTEVKQHKLAAAMVVIALVLGAVGLFAYLHSRNTEVAIESIAVLPFDNQNRDPNTEYLSDGVTESIINSLTQLPNLKVIARSSVFRYKEKEKEIDPLKAGRELGVRAVLTGRIMQRGDNLTIGTELMDVRDNKQLWGEQYSVKVTDLLSVQREIATKITSNLRLKLSGAEQQQLAKRYTDNVEAYQFYLKGRYEWSKFSQEGVRNSIEYYNQALAIDPNYALAYVWLSHAYNVLGVSYLPPKEMYPKMNAYVAKALAIDETLGQAHAAMGTYKTFYEWDWTGAEREFKRALALSPNDAQTHNVYALYLEAMGRLDEAKGKRAQELDPFSALIRSDLGRALDQAGQYDEAIEQEKKALDLDPHLRNGYLWLGAAYEQKGMYREAIAELKKGIEMSERHPFLVSSLGHVYAVAGQRGEAQKTLGELQEMSKHRYVSSEEIALIYTGLGDKEQALRFLEKAYEERTPRLIWIGVEPRFAPLRSDPRFAELLRRIGLPQ
jgi:serine/threonine-protein kinase